jgi:DNA-binding GntR family transcriptional regulator
LDGRPDNAGELLAAISALGPPFARVPGREKLARSLYSGAILAALREEIVKGRYPKGTRLVESRLAAELGVSRGPVRTALQALEAEGLVEPLPNGRMVVVGFGLDDLASLFRVRQLLESTAIRWGVEQRAETTPVYDACEGFTRLDAVDERTIEVDVGFHRALIEFGRSRFLLQAWLSLAPILRVVMNIALRAASGEFAARSCEYIVSTHMPIAEAIVGYDAERAVTLLEEQFEDAEARLGRYYSGREQSVQRLGPDRGGT